MIPSSVNVHMRGPITFWAREAATSTFWECGEALSTVLKVLISGLAYWLLEKHLAQQLLLGIGVTPTS